MTAPMYISVAWSLIISYQLFTQTAVYSIIYFLNNLLPSTAEFLILRIDMVVFIHTFAWIFVLSSVIPSMILGKARSVLLQFFLCLTITFVAVSVEDILALMIGTAPIAKIQIMSVWFQNPLIAGTYLSAPYLSMLYLDIHSRRKSAKEEEPEETEAIIYEEVIPAEQEVSDTAITQETNDVNQVCQRESKGRMNFLYGASAACFLLAFVTFWLGDSISSTILAMSHKLVYIAAFISLGAILLSLGRYSTNTNEQACPH
ncbi:hypothetical protein KAU88_10160 [Candidatus Bathyarchaeota archaeon]|nr:hypothetical protein [Candidatus Bathyarchaeota archaeon]